MTEQLTIELMNEVIAVFDGWKFIEGDPNHKCKFCFAGDDPCTPAVDRFIKNGVVRFHYDLKYDSDWNWLHNAWETFRDLKFGNPRQQKEHSDWKSPIDNAICYQGIKSAHLLLYNGIQWLNKQQ